MLDLGHLIIGWSVGPENGWTEHENILLYIKQEKFITGAVHLGGDGPVHPRPHWAGSSSVCRR